MARTIVVTSGKGGVGKSSISVNLATALASHHAKVCLIDADFGLKNLDVMMGLENRVIYDLKDVVEGRCNLEQVLIKDKRVPTLFLIPACKSLKFTDFKVDYMKTVVDHFKHQFDCKQSRRCRYYETERYAPTEYDAVCARKFALNFTLIEFNRKFNDKTAENNRYTHQERKLCDVLASAACESACANRRAAS